MKRPNVLKFIYVSNGSQCNVVSGTSSVPILCFYASLGSNTTYLLAGAISVYDYMVNLFVYNNENKRFHSPLDEYECS